MRRAWRPMWNRHFAVSSAWKEGGDGVNDKDVNGAGLDQGLGNLESLFAVSGWETRRCRHRRRVFWRSRVEGVLGIDEGSQASGLLCFRDDLQADGGFAEDSGHRSQRRGTGMPPTPSAASKLRIGGDDRNGQKSFPRARRTIDLYQTVFDLRKGSSTAFVRSSGNAIGRTPQKRSPSSPFWASSGLKWVGLKLNFEWIVAAGDRQRTEENSE